MFLIKVRTPFFEHNLLATNPRECLKTLWALAGQDFEVVVHDECDREVSLLHLEAQVSSASAPEAKLGSPT